MTIHIRPDGNCQNLGFEKCARDLKMRGVPCSFHLGSTHALTDHVCFNQLSDSGLGTHHLAFVPTSDPPGDYLPSEFGQSWDWFKDTCIGNTNPI